MTRFTRSRRVSIYSAKLAPFVPFTELLAHAGLESPFDEACLRDVCDAAERWLHDFDLTGIS